MKLLFCHGGVKNGLKMAATRSAKLRVNCAFSTIYALTMTKIHLVQSSHVSYLTAAYLMQNGLVQCGNAFICYCSRHCIGLKYVFKRADIFSNIRFI
jgi:hypothetical protein